MSKPAINNRKSSIKDDGDNSTIDGQSHLKSVSNLAIGINRVAIAVNHDEESVVRNYAVGTDESKAEMAVGGCAASASSSAYASTSASASGKASMLESDCDRSQSSFRARGKIDLRSPRWMDQGHHQANNGYGSLTEDNAMVSFSMIKRKASSASSHENRDRASPSSQTDTAHDSHDDGYLSHSTADGGYQSGGYHSYHRALSYAPSVKSDIATGEKCSTFYSNAIHDTMTTNSAFFADFSFIPSLLLVMIHNMQCVLDQSLRILIWPKWHQWQVMGVEKEVFLRSSHLT